MKRRRFVWIAAAVILVAVAGAAWWATRPTAFAAVYDRVAIGMTIDEVERLIPCPESEIDPEGLDWVLRWEGQIGGEYQRVSADRSTGLEDGIYTRSLAYRILLCNKMTVGPEARLSHWWDSETGECFARSRQCYSGPDRLRIVFDVQGRVAEKEHLQVRERAGLLNFMRRSFHWWPL
jgi:hypothetical protein